MNEEKSAKPLTDAIKKDAAVLAKKGLDSAKEKFDSVDIDKTKEQVQGVLGKVLNIQMSSMKFLAIYLVLMTPTYVMRMGAITAGFDEAMKGGSADGIGAAANFMLFICLSGLCLVTYLRGKTVGKKHLVAFPTVALVVDLILPFVLFVPTIMHIITLVLGVPDKKVAEISNADEITKLSDLKDKGIISEEEFESKKKEIMS
jgi:hypothetical protein